MKIEPIGFYHAPIKTKTLAPRQGVFDQSTLGLIKIKSEYALCLNDLEGIERVWLIFHFHHNQDWKNLVLPPTSSKKRGVFSTRSPYRPNFLGLTCVKIEKLSRREIYVSGADLLDQTPIFDIKPYLPYADSFPKSKIGWIAEEESQSFKVSWKKSAQKQKHLLLKIDRGDLVTAIEQQLKYHPTDNKRKRVKRIDGNEYEFSLRYLRCRFSVAASSERKLEILELRSEVDFVKLKKSQVQEDDLVLHHILGNSP